jgi:hypothetical protein
VWDGIGGVVGVHDDRRVEGVGHLGEVRVDIKLRFHVLVAGREFGRVVLGRS